MGPGVTLEPERHLGGQMCSNTCVLSAKVAWVTIWCNVWSLDMDFDGKFTVTYDTHGSPDAGTDAIKSSGLSLLASSTYEDLAM